MCKLRWLITASFVPPAFRSGRDILNSRLAVVVDATGSYGKILASWGIRYQADGGSEMRVNHMGRLHDLLHVTILLEFRYVS